MKIRVTLDINVEMGNLSSEGTSCQGYLPKGTRYKDIVRVFGRPQYKSSRDSKIGVEWVGTINGLVFTIYDYKSSLAPQKNLSWHIGGKNVFTAQLVNFFLVAKIK